MSTTSADLAGTERFELLVSQTYLPVSSSSTGLIPSVQNAELASVTGWNGRRAVEYVARIVGGKGNN